MEVNYQRKLEEIINSLNGKVPSLLLHSCCAPCSSYVLKYLSDYFNITVFYYNPNIYPNIEYNKRMEEQIRLVSTIRSKHPISFMEANYNPEEFFRLTRGLEKDREGNIRCFKCYQMRMEESATIAKTNHFDYFTTTLSVSPYKNSDKINEIGYMLEDKYHINYLCGDFKKKNGYLESIKLSNYYNLYRQDYCGCIYSKVNKEEI